LSSPLPAENRWRDNIFLPICLLGHPLANLGVKWFVNLFARQLIAYLFSNGNRIQARMECNTWQLSLGIFCNAANVLPTLALGRTLRQIIPPVLLSGGFSAPFCDLSALGDIKIPVFDNRKRFHQSGTVSSQEDSENSRK
jgi:hypothetical protein